MVFQDRRTAGCILARNLEFLRGHRDAIVLALPRGGVPVGYEVAGALDLPLDILIVRKLGVPGHAELAMGAIASGGAAVMNLSIVNEFAISGDVIERVTRREALEIERREREYRDGQTATSVDGCIALLIDDGLATGASMHAAVRAVRPRARQIIVAVPVGARAACDELRGEVDQLICVTTPQLFVAVGASYRNFEQTTDLEVRRLLAQARHRAIAPAKEPGPGWAA